MKKVFVVLMIVFMVVFSMVPSFAENIPEGNEPVVSKDAVVEDEMATDDPKEDAQDDSSVKTEPPKDDVQDDSSVKTEPSKEDAQDDSSVKTEIKNRKKQVLSASPKEVTAVATIKGKTGDYETLAAALTAAVDGDTVLLWQDVKENISTTSKNYTLDLQNHKIAPDGGRVFNINGGEVTLKNGTLTGGEKSDGSGAGLNAISATLHVNNLTISKNSSGGGKGNVHLEKTKADFTDSTVTGNVSKEFGSGFFLSESTLEGNNLKVSNNKFDEATGEAETNQRGGGIYAADDSKSTVTLKDSTISGNIALKGGGIYTCKNTLVLDRTTVTKNAALRTVTDGNKFDSEGGGVYVDSGQTTVKNDCTFSYNSGESAFHMFKMGFEDSTGKMEISGSTFSSNDGEALCVRGFSNATIKGCTITKNYSGIEIGDNTGTALIENTKINENDGTDSAGKGLSSGIWSFGDVTIKNVELNNNKDVGYVLYYSGSAAKSLKATDITIKNNVASRTLYLEGTVVPISVVNADIESNTSNYSTVEVYNSDTNTEFKNCLIRKNTAGYAGGIYANIGGFFGDADVTLTNTVIKENEATAVYKSWDDTLSTYDELRENAAGGVWMKSGRLNLVSGAIYNNKTSGSNLALDICIAQKYCNPDIISAKSMTDSTDTSMNFSEYLWRNSMDSTEVDAKIVGKDTAVRALIATPHVERKVAKIGEDKKFPTLQEAVDAAAAGNTITLIAGDGDNFGNKFKESNVTINKNLTIDVNGKTIQNKGTTLSVDNAALTIKGAGTIEGDIDLKTNSTLTMNGSAQPAGSIIHNGKALNINGTYKLLTVDLKSGKKITFGDDFSTDSLVLKAESALTDLNDPLTPVADIVVGENATKDIAAKSKIADVTNKFVTVIEKDGKLLIHKVIPEGVFINGQSGSDTNTGTAYGSPVKTFEKAKQVLADNPKFDTIYVLGKINVSGKTTWDLDGKTMQRYPAYTGTIAEISADAELTLKSIVIDGGKTYEIDNAYSMLVVNQKATLNINEGAVLQNNDITKNSGSDIDKHAGGAVYSSGTIVIDGGTIQNCSAVQGGGIYCSSGELTLNDGKIINNENYAGFESKYPSGGGIMADSNSTFHMNGGTVEGNEASYGGGISIGGYYFYSHTNTDESFVMDGGTIKNNTARVAGGGIFIQSTFNATINKGKIIDNTSKSGHFSGGGIYVNGGKNGYRNGRLQLYNVLISANQAAEDGGGIAACGTSVTKVYLTNGGVIYNNTGFKGEDFKEDGRKNDIFLSNTDDYNMPNVGPPDFFLSEYMLGGGAYLWRNLSKYSDLTDVHGKDTLSIYTEVKDGDPEVEAAKKLAEVFITGNSANRRGGGIGSNGDVIIGEKPTDTIDISVEKIWNDNNNANNLRPDTIRIWLLRNGERVSCIYFNKDTTGALKFTDQPRLDSNGNEYKYTVEEDTEYADPENMKGNYVGIVEKVEGKDNTYKVTNSLTGKLTVSKTVSGSGADKDKSFDFKVTLDDKTISGKYGEMAFDKGVAQFKLKDGESIVATGLPEGTKYTVVESNNQGYTVTINKTAATEAEGTIATDKPSVAAFNNDKSKEEKPSPEPCSYGPSIKKTVEGNAQANDTYSFTLKSADINNPMPKGSKDGVKTISLKGAGDKKFGDIFYDKEGTYIYSIEEVKGDIKNCTYDKIVYKLTVTVTKNANSAILTAKGVITKPDGTAVNTCKFTNTYSDTPTTPGDKPKKPGDKGVKTGDDSNIALWAILAALGLLGTAGAVVARKKENDCQ